MKKFLASIIALVCALCLYWGASTLSVVDKASASEVQEQSRSATVVAPQKGGMTFTTSTYFDTQDLYTSVPHSYEAVIKVTDGGSSRTGIIIGNFFNGSNGTAQSATNFEIGTGGIPKIYALPLDGDTAQINFQFTKLATLNTYESVAGFLNDYFHIAITVDSANKQAHLYINGILVETKSNTASDFEKYDAMKMSDLKITSSTGEIRSFRVGGDFRSGNAQYFKGAIKSVSVFKDCRSASEVENDFIASSTTAIVSNTDNLEACYDLTNADNYYTTINEPSSRMETTHVKDLSTNCNDLTYSVAKSRGGMTFTADTKLVVPTLSKAPRTVEVAFMLSTDWVGKRAGAILGNYESGSYPYLSYELYNGTNCAEPRVCAVKDGNNNNRNLVGVNVATGNIVYLTYVYDDVNKRVIGYVNGKHVYTNTATATYYTAEELMVKNFVIGGDNRSGNAQYFKGTLYSVVAYSDVRTAQEIEQDYNYAIASDSGFKANVNNDDLLIAYDLTDAVGNYVKNSITGETYQSTTPTIIKDYSGNGYDITPTIPAQQSVTAEVYSGFSVNNSDEYYVEKKFESNPYTFEAEITVPKTQNVRGGLFSSYLDSFAKSVSFEIQANGALRVFYYSKDGKFANVLFSTKINTGLKTHVAIVLDPSTTSAHLYVNGVLVETKTDATFVEYHKDSTKSKHFIVGNDNRHLYSFPGYIHSISAYSNIRSASEIAND